MEKKTLTIIFIEIILTILAVGQIAEGKRLYSHDNNCRSRDLFHYSTSTIFCRRFNGISFSLIAQHYLVGVLGVILMAIYYQNTFEEEMEAIKKFGEDYRQYMKKVPRFNFIQGIIRSLNKKNGFIF
jgi:protein-S-isoprenylcysteine O-methyltransferase Ste14